MEISKGLQEEIVLVQNKLKNAIRDHQIYVGQQKNDPNNADIVDGLRKITLHIVALGRWQKQVVQRLRKEVESYKAENALNGARISVASLLGLNNNNHITHNNESATTRRHNAETPEESKPLLNGHADSRASSKEDYEETVRNGDVASPLRDDASVKERLPSPVVPAPVENGAIAVNAAAAKPEKNGGEEKPKVTDKQQQFFMGRLGLITRARLVELQNKRAERKRRSTANSHFVYNNWEVPTKRRRHAYLQSLGSAPQTRQTTARLNGPSPPPKPYNKPGPKPGAAAAARSLIQASNKPGPKPAILRNGDGKQKEFFSGKIVKQETEKNSGNSSSSSSNGRDSEQRKSAQQTTSTGKAVHIPGLPSSLTIERIENDSSICVTCRNPGTLTVCEYCSAKFHVSCHTTSPGPTAKSFSTCYCPKCMASFRSQNILEKSIKKETAAAYASRVIGKTGEDAEVHKAPSGLYQADAAQPGRQLLTAAALGINQLPSSTFLIPIAATSSASNDSGGIVSVATVDQSLLLSSSSSLLGSATTAARLGYAIEQQKQTSILLNQLSQPSVTTANGNGESRILRQAKDIAAGQSLLLVDKVARQRPGKRGARQSFGRRWKTKSVLDFNEWSNASSTDAESKPKSGLPVTKSSNYVTVEVIYPDDDEDRSRARNENSSDYVYIELESPRPKPIQQQEPEVLNISFESSEVPSVDESDQPAAIEHLETTSKSPCSSESDSTRDRDQQQQQQEDTTFDDSSANHSTTSCHNDDDDNFLSTIFPGRYGYKIDVIDIGTPTSELDESFENSSTEPEVTSQPESQNEQSEHVKLEEAHLSAPLGTELVKETIVGDTTIEEPLAEMVEETPVEEMSVEETPVEEISAEETPVEETEDRPFEETETEEIPVEETEVQDTSVEETQIEVTTVELAEAEDIPAEEMQIEEASVEDASAEEAQFKDTPIEETMVVETPVEDRSEHSEESTQLPTVPDNKSDEVDEVREQSDKLPDSESGERYSGDHVSSDETIVDAMTETIAMMAD
ncbi:uncharacterized protein LOC100680516 isoform X2 [Nasonia vitripennis]|uniref:PHD-type domain-containing protein n=1 Tax=Nasonia vitripennis TaxID=7425 RepID=A0A7M7QA85_NASVI|nr:uncharacterized protein LOC100680516 isoform X2 [Nasonia vitripennis]